MSALDVVAELEREISGGDLAKAASYLADDFEFVGVGPEPLNREMALGVWQALRSAMPDFHHNMKGQREAGNIVYATVEVTGTHTGTFFGPGGVELPATGRTLRNPLERIALVVRGDRVVRWEVEQVPGGGLSGILGQLS